MRSIFLSILTSFLLLGTTELHQFLKLPVLLKHFQVHKKQDKSLSLRGFLALHYSQDHPIDNDDSDDNQLPFKNPEAINHVDITIIPFRLETEELLLMGPEITRSYHPEGAPCHLSYAVFHPPQIF
ncbi:MAG: hypothetical protein JNK27_02055 [Chitinophagaceae bacterium]|nr:hypothetical protein [Chitinophagaceae bacterium]